MGSLLLPLCPHVHNTLCVPSNSGVSVFPSPVEVLQSNPASLQSLILLEFLLPLPDPQVGKPDVGLRTFTTVGGLQWYKCSPVCESSTQQLWDLILLWLHPSYRLIVASPLSLDVGHFFGEFQCLPVDDCSAVCCDYGVLAGGSESTSFYYVILNQSLCFDFFIVLFCVIPIGFSLVVMMRLT